MAPASDGVIPRGVQFHVVEQGNSRCMEGWAPEAIEVLVGGIWTRAFALSWSQHANTLWANVRTLDDVLGCFPESDVRDLTSR